MTKVNVRKHAGNGNPIKTLDVYLTEKVELANYLHDSPLLQAAHPQRKYKKYSYPDIRLISDYEPEFLQTNDWKEGEPEI